MEGDIPPEHELPVEEQMLTRREAIRRIAGRAASLGTAAYALLPLGTAMRDVGVQLLGEEEEKASAHAQHGESLEETVHKEHHVCPIEHKIDWMGTANFGDIIYGLSTNHNVRPWHFASTWGLLGAKYAVADDAGRHHIKTELKDGWDAFRVILGTTIAAEGVGMNLEKIVQNTRGRDPTLEETIFIASMLSPFTSSATTTVGSSTILRNEVHRLINSIADDYQSRLEEDMSTSEARERAEKLKKAMYADNIAHISDASGFMFFGDPPFYAMIQKYGTEGFLFQNKTMWAPLLYSTGRYMTKMMSRLRDTGIYGGLRGAAEIMSDPEHWKMFGEIMTESFINSARMGADFLTAHRDRMIGQDPRGVEFDIIGAYEDKLSDLNALRKRYDFSRRLKGQLEEAVGENMADVIVVFPHQALSIPFLQTSFKDWLGGLDKAGLKGDVKDAAMFLSIAGFSSLADNYVACKIGLELYPERPEIPLVASILGGQLLPPGNMANMSLVDQHRYSIADGAHPRRLMQHMDMLGLGFAYAKAVPHLRKIPVLGTLYDKTGIMETLEKTA